MEEKVVIVYIEIIKYLGINDVLLIDPLGKVKLQWVRPHLDSHDYHKIRKFNSIHLIGKIQINKIKILPKYDEIWISISSRNLNFTNWISYFNTSVFFFFFLLVYFHNLQPDIVIDVQTGQLLFGVIRL